MYLNRLYWVDAQKDFIASCDLDGKAFKKVLENVPELIHPFSIAIHKVCHVKYDIYKEESVF